MATHSNTRAAPGLVGCRHLPERTGAVMQCAEGVDAGPRRSLMPFSERSLTHGEKNQPLAVGMETAPEPRAVPRLVGTCHLPERVGARIQCAEGVDAGPHRPLMPFSKRSLTHGEKIQPVAVGMEPAPEHRAVSYTHLTLPTILLV